MDVTHEWFTRYRAKLMDVTLVGHPWYRAKLMDVTHEWFTRYRAKLMDVTLVGHPWYRAKLNGCNT